MLILQMWKISYTAHLRLQLKNTWQTKFPSAYKHRKLAPMVLFIFFYLHAFFRALMQKDYFMSSCYKIN